MTNIRLRHSVVKGNVACHECR